MEKRIKNNSIEKMQDFINVCYPCDVTDDLLFDTEKIYLRELKNDFIISTNLKDSGRWYEMLFAIEKQRQYRHSEEKSCIYNWFIYMVSIIVYSLSLFAKQFSKN